MKTKMVRIIRVSSNAKLDYNLPEKVALELYKSGALKWDVTNGQFCH